MLKVRGLPASVLEEASRMPGRWVRGVVYAGKVHDNRRSGQLRILTAGCHSHNRVDT